MQGSQSGPALARYGRYEVLFRIASGGMAEVYAARIVGEGGFEKMVALKRMLPTLAEDERFVGMFLDEGRVAANISSPHVVQTLDLGRAEDDSLYLVMELVVGVSLSALMRKVSREGEHIPVPIAVEILAQAALGLHDAHEARTVYGEPLAIVHRDVSPHNVMVDVAGRTRITDFGVARALERVTQTQSGEVKGKLAYFAPEQARAKDIDRRTDVFALGIVAWELLSGKRLFAGDNPAQTLTNVLTMPIPRLDEVRVAIPRSLADVVAAALERDRAARTPDAAAFARALRASGAAASSAEVAAFVRSHGGAALMSLEEGLRAQSPSSASGRGPGRERSGVGLAREVASDDAPTTVTPSNARQVTTGAPATTAISIAARQAEPASMAAGPARPSWAPIAIAGGLMIVGLAVGGLVWALGGGSETMQALELPVAAEPGGSAAEREIGAGAAVTEPPAIAAPVEDAEAVPEVRAVDRASSDERAAVRTRARTAEARPRSDAARAEPARAEPVRAEPARTEPARTGPAEPPRTEPPRTEPARTEPPRTEPARTEPARTEPPRTVPASPRPGPLRGLDDFERELGS